MTTLEDNTTDGSFSGTGALVRLTLRTERIATPVGVLIVPALLLATAAALRPLYPDAAARRDFASIGTSTNPVFRILLGPLRDTSGIGPIAVWRIGMFALLIVAIMVAATVTRNLRAPESTGRLELLRTGAVGSAAPVAAAAITAALSAVAAGAFTGLAAAVIGVPGVSAALVGVQFACAGIAAAGIALVVDQVVTSSRTALATSSGVLLTAYIIRGIADTFQDWSFLEWLSPLGWAERIDPFGGRTLWPAAPCLFLFVVGFGVACSIVRRRDLGAGLISPKPGPPSARWPISILGVTVRTMGAPLAPWLSGAFGYCLLVGLLTNSVGDLLGGSGGTRDLIHNLGGGSMDLVAALMNTVIGLVAIAATAAAVSVAGSLRQDDRSGRSEILLATAVSAHMRLISAVVLAFVGAALILVLAAVGLVVGAVIVGGSGPGVGDVVITAVIQLPPTMAVAAIGFAAYGFGARWLILGWVAVVVDLILGPLGSIVGAPQWLRNISPHAHIPAVVGGTVPATATWISLAMAVALVGLAAWAVRRRDLA